MKEWYSNGSPLKVLISTSGADCYRNKLHNILLISPSKSLVLGNKAFFAWASAAQLVLSHEFFEDDLMFLISCSKHLMHLFPLYMITDLSVPSTFVDEHLQLFLYLMQLGIS